MLTYVKAKVIPGESQVAVTIALASAFQIETYEIEV